MLSTQLKTSQETATLPIQIERLPHGKDLSLPTYATTLSAGVDLMAAIDEPIILKPGQRALIPAGIAIALPEGYEAQIRSRSGLAYKNGVVILNAPGTIDADYRGEIKGILINLGQESFTVTPGMRFAQMVVAPVFQVSWVESSLTDLPTDRGVGGFGSTGV